MICINARFLSRRITGAQRYAVEISREMRRLDPAVRLIGSADTHDAGLSAELGCEVVGRRRGIAWEQLDLPRALRARGNPLLIGLTFTAPLRYQPTIVTVHDVCFLHRDWVSRGFYHYYGFLVPRLCRRAERVVTVSEFSKSEIVRHLGIPADKIEVVYNAVSPTLLTNDDEAGLANGGDAAADGSYVLGVATLQKRKNFAGLVRAFRQIEDPTVRLVIVGSADRSVYGRQPELARLLEDPRVELAGYVSDRELARLYRGARVFCYPSHYEGFGIPPIEAMSQGCPVITSKVTSLPEVCGDAAHYVDPNDEDDIAAALRRVLGDDDYRDELAAKGRVRAARYSWSQSAARFLEIARECA